MTHEQPTKRDAALEYASHGVPVFQVWHAEGARCGCRARGCVESPAKHPIASTAPAGFKNATTDPDTIQRWFKLFPQANIAEATGHYSVVLDVDPAKGGRESLARLEATHGLLPVTAKVLTGGGGEHYRFLPVPGLGCSSGRVGPGLDIRAEGGYALLPPSDHVSGGVYLDDLLAPMFETPLAPAPPWLEALARASQGPDGSNGNHRTSDEWAEKLAGAPEGQRRALALEIAGHYLGLRIAPEEVETILLGYAARCSPPFPEREARALVRDLARRDRARDRARGESAAPPRNEDGPVLVCLGDVAPELVVWTWPGRVARGKLSLIVGEPGTGKSHVTLDMTARTTGGLPWPDGGDAPEGPVLILASEDGLADTVRPIVDRQGGDALRVHVLRAVRIDGQECPFNLERDLPALEQALQQTKAVLVIISPLSSYLGSRDSYKDAEMRAILDPLAALAERYRAAVVGILHLTKAQQRRLLNRAQGSVAFVAVARLVLAVGEDRDHPGRRLLASVKNNLGPEAPALAFRISDAGLTWEPTPIIGSADRLLAGDDAPTRTETRELDEAVAFLRDVLHDGPVASKQVEADARGNGIAQRTLWRAKKEIGCVADRARTADGRTAGWFWRLPVDTP